MSNTLSIEDHLMDRQSAYGQKISILNKDVLILAVSEVSPPRWDFVHLMVGT